ncbi:sigma-E factor negative regulatory protein RseC [Caldicoprobacter guelmensis]|uniref:SoxR reducing system RseC family protein n=1 Tax=Caldicoprobacter guelmensis TaxID=1170224 RepID=UPI0019577B07|nr:SoxR reducing system RseC family protein [Caldicoprobacter guelmensis]MBM7582289.1 sigma-E factor negative regulatory protein RseC [Caldicoprobacter guelmensis]
MTEVGEVVRTKGDMAVVRLKRNSACSRCGACGLGAGPDDMFLTLPNTLKAKPGDLVELSLESGQLLKASAITYVIPLIALIVGVVMGYMLGERIGIDRQLAGAILGIVFTAAAFGAIRALDPLFRRSNHFVPRMVSILSNNINDADL